MEGVEMSGLRIQLFGRVCVRSDDGQVLGIEAGKPQELLCYLLFHWGAAQHRERLADLLWGDGPAPHAKKYLRQALWQLQSALHPYVDSLGQPILVAETDWIQVNGRADVWIDTAMFQRAFEGVRGTPGRELTAEQVLAAQEAVHLHSAPLLEGWYQDWCLYERERLFMMYIAMLDKLIGFHAVHNQYEAAIGYSTLVLNHDRARERTHRQLMQLHELAGDRTAALRQYQRCCAALQEELSVRPSRRTVDLYERIRSGQLEAAGWLPETRLPASITILEEALVHLRRFQSVLTSVQQEVQADIQTLERTVRDG
jgi:DNA-binding SARP family transcriptional activator